MDDHERLELYKLCSQDVDKFLAEHTSDTDISDEDLQRLAAKMPDDATRSKIYRWCQKRTKEMFSHESR